MRLIINLLRFFVPAVLAIPFLAVQPVSAQTFSSSKSAQDSLLKTMIARADQFMYSNPDSSIYYSRLASERSKLVRDSSALALSKNYLGKAYYIKGSYEQSLKNSLKALSLAEFINDRKNIAMARNEIGLVYLGHDQYDLALTEFLESIEVAKVNGDSAWMAAPLFNAGICFDHKEEYGKALNCFNRALANDSGRHVSLMSINRLGETWLHLHHPDSATRYYRAVLANPRVTGNLWELAFAYAGLAQVAYLQKSYDSAAALAEKSYQYARTLNAKWDVERAAKILAESYAALHRYQDAYAYMQIDRTYNDSLYHDSREAVVNFLKLKQREKEFVELQAESDKDKKIIHLRTFFFAGACLLALLLIGLAIVLYRNYRVKNRLSGALLESNELKDQLFSVISHDLRSPMASIQQMLEFMKTKDMGEEERARMYDMFYRQVTLNNNMLNNLLQWVSSQMPGSELKANKELVDPAQIVGEVFSVYRFMSQEKRISLENELPAGMPIRGDKEHLKIIFQNLIGNALKFTRPGGRIRIFHTLEDDQLTIHIADNGVGIPAGKLATIFDKAGPSQSTFGTAREKGTGIGLQLVRRFVERNDGKISISSVENEGTETRLSFLFAKEPAL